MKKELKNVLIFKRNYKGAGIKFSKFPKGLLPNDVIYFTTDEDRWEYETTMTIFRKRLETDKEFKIRKELYEKEIEERKRLAKEFRYKEFLKLKKEFKPKSK